MGAKGPFGGYHLGGDSYPPTTFAAINHSHPCEHNQLGSCKTRRGTSWGHFISTRRQRVAANVPCYQTRNRLVFGVSSGREPPCLGLPMRGKPPAIQPQIMDSSQGLPCSIARFRGATVSLGGGKGVVAYRPG